MASSSRIPRRPIPLALQLAHLRRRWPALQTSIGGGVLRAEGLITPNPLSVPYLITLTYTLGQRQQPPLVRVKEPRIVPFRGEDQVPHVYDRSTDPRPCLFYPDGREWHSGLLVATTILPWLLLWLTFYEVWLATGAWVGGGIAHSPGKA